MNRIHSCVVSAALALAALTPGSSIYAEDQEHDQGVRQELKALKAQVASLQTTVKTLQSQLTTVQANKALKLGSFVDVDLAMENRPSADGKPVLSSAACGWPIRQWTSFETVKTSRTLTACLIPRPS